MGDGETEGGWIRNGLGEMVTLETCFVGEKQLHKSIIAMNRIATLGKPNFPLFDKNVSTFEFPALIRNCCSSDRNHQLADLNTVFSLSIQQKFCPCISQMTVICRDRRQASSLFSSTFTCRYGRQMGGLNTGLAKYVAPLRSALTTIRSSPAT